MKRIGIILPIVVIVTILSIIAFTRCCNDPQTVKRKSTTSINHQQQNTSDSIMDVTVIIDDDVPHSSYSTPQSSYSTPQLTANTSNSSRWTRPSNPIITLDQAIEIAYADLERRGINATYRSNSGLDFERGQWVWELLFRTQGEHMPLIEYYINVDTGDIVKFEWDD